MIDGGLLPNRNFVNRRREDEAESDFNRYEDSLENHTRRHNNRVGSTFETFMKCKPPTFKGSTDPQVCFQWFLKMDQTFDSGVFTEAQRVSYAIRMLEGSALEWWNSVSRTLSSNARASLTWEAFSNKYNTAFTEKLQFANKLCPDEESKVARYVEGLPYEYRTSVRSKTTLEEAMEERSSKMFKGNSNNKKYDNNNEEKKCVECNSRHTGECTMETRRCFRCGKKGHVGQDCTSKEPICYSCKEMGHISTNCPNKKVGSTGGTNTRKDELPRPKTRAFHMTAEEEKVDNESEETNETYAMYANRA
ncbi:zinc finger, CCHC-type, Retrotransposon gag domain protein [Artemisia annua]|uniref:Zinc finger, CCHC-type, Retrotransposon gag domain protein n=1 Tax=Artemisia annua TaxID=35608 RepID=A0A2U1KUU4_ARTAN|nr:zinc finger, CCHC-type, Retrotransposon gag domain protein [Artemisia annua]